MHETGIAAGILEIAETEAKRRNAFSVAGICIRVGDFSNVVPEALEFAFDALKAGTLAAGARLEIERVPVAANCPQCNQSVRPKGAILLWCPRCGGPLQVTAGAELDVVSIDLEVSEVTCSASR
ncbi:MAG: hydrogenase maturation nickel metallochaperone HypA [Bryobacterales bacterium]|nr:hydrogenase maturation nickel metallochaperone HypA [Bryobacterales bacterium]